MGHISKFISSDWASQRISLLDLKDVLFRLLKLKKARRGLMPKVVTSEKGIGQMFDIMSEKKSPKWVEKSS